MSLFGGISSWLTGGRDKQAEDALNRALQAYSDIKVPTAQELSLPELQMYVNAGLMTPAQAEAYLQESNAFETMSIPQTGTDAMVQALNQLSSIADAGPMGTPLQQAQAAQTIQQMNNAVMGQRGAIEQAMQAKGTPAAMIQAALANQYAGQDAQQAYHNSLDQQAATYQAALQALSQKGNLGATLQGQQNQQANTVAAAQNAMQQFNAQNQQNAAEANAARMQAANSYNTQNTQNISNQNTSMKNARTAYNTAQRQTEFDNAMRRAQGMAGVYNSQAANYQDMGKQAAGAAAGIFSALAPSASAFGFGVNPSQGAMSGAGGGGQAAGGAGASDLAGMALVAKGGILTDHDGCYHDGGICMDDGGFVPGQAKVPGDSLQNDTVHVMASPGEAVIPRSVVQQNMPQVLGLIAQGQNGNSPNESMGGDVQDVATVLQALRQLRMGVPA